MSRKSQKEEPQGQAMMPPASPEAEQATLGSILIKPSVMDEIVDLLSTIDFYGSSHQKIFRVMLELYLRNEPVDITSVNLLLKERGQLEEVGGPLFLMGLSDQVGIAANAPYYAKVVRDKAILRRLLATTQEIAGACLAPVENVAEFLDFAENAVFQVGAQRQRRVVTLGEILPEERARIEELYYKKIQLLGISTGFLDLDKFTGGLQPTDLILVAARPSMGKTSLALNIAFNAAHKSHVPTAVFSLEMSREQLLHRLIASVGSIDCTRLRTGKMENDEWKRFEEVDEVLRELPLYIDDSARLTPLEIRAQARRLQATHGIGLIIIDYLQLMREPKAQSREQEVAEISRSLKALAKELRLPVVALSQLNRKVEERSNKQPMLADLRDSGSLEQDADVIIFIYRDEFYHENSADKGLAEIIMAKQRMGPTGKFKMTFQGWYSRFGDHYDGSLF